ncbi:MAG: hypothetical protein SA378_11555 [Sedimentibacter sp.]|uniref:hypothetical protein n=1 Tax=Sedimentibacter sp. TaxID=1960295 RepID=UPI002980B207|nr:hypothetical protein [Sedimentibacter sp.]MDW5300751.1 hypothetical protein [Sedimentibacter sp.]
MAKIYAPNKEYTGVIAGVVFNKGIGETQDKRLKNWFEEKGYKVVEEEKKGKKEKPDKTVDEMTVEELKAYAESKEIDLGESKLREEILEVIKGSK